MELWRGLVPLVIGKASISTSAKNVERALKVDDTPRLKLELENTALSLQKRRAIVSSFFTPLTSVMRSHETRLSLASYCTHTAFQYQFCSEVVCAVAP